MRIGVEIFDWVSSKISGRLLGALGKMNFACGNALRRVSFFEVVEDNKAGANLSAEDPRP